MFLTWEHGFWRKRGIPGPRPLPLFGTTLQMLKTGFFLADRLASRKHGRVVGLYAGRTPELLLSDVDIVKQIMVKKFDNFTNRGDTGRGFSEYQYGIGKMLIVLMDEEWRNVRNAMTPAFSASKLKMMVKHINECVDILVSIIDTKSKEEKGIIVKRLTDLFSFDVIGRIAFGVEMDVQTDVDSAFSRFGRDIFRFNFFSPGVVLLYWFPGLFRPVKKLFPNMLSAYNLEAVAYFMEITARIIDQRKLHPNADKHNLIQLMLNAHKEEIKQEDIDTEIGGYIYRDQPKRELSYEEILGNSFISLTAGFETTSLSLTYLLYNLAVYPDCQAKVRAEVDRLAGDTSTTTITYEMAQSCPYLEMCIMESLRLYPPFPRIDRQSKEDISLNGIFIPKGMTVMISIASLHYDPEAWPEPDTFKPERFTDEAKAERDPFYYMPFGMGPRNCIGIRIAQMELRIAAIKILQGFSVKTCEKTPIPLKLDVTGLLDSRDPVVLRFEPR